MDSKNVKTRVVRDRVAAELCLKPLIRCPTKAKLKFSEIKSIVQHLQKKEGIKISEIN